MMSANWTLPSDSSPPHRAWNTTEKTKVYTHSISNGVKNDQATPIAAPL